MGKELEVARTLFRLIVSQLEEMDREERPFTRIEWTGEGLEIDLSGGEGYRIEVRPAPKPESNPERERSGKSVQTWNKPGEERDVVEVPVKEWEELVRTCEMVIQFLEYDKDKMEELAELAPDFPWEKRSAMMEGLLRGLRGCLAKSAPEESASRR